MGLTDVEVIIKCLRNALRLYEQQKDTSLLIEEIKDIINDFEE